MADHKTEGPKWASSAQNSLLNPAGLKDRIMGAPAGAMTSAAPTLPLAGALATHRLLVYHVSTNA